MTSRSSRLRSLLSPTSSSGRELLKTARPRVAREKVQSRLDWARFARALHVEPRQNLIRLGASHGGYVVPGDVIEEDWICYSAGLGEEISFELDLIRRYGCTVYAFDPVPKSARYVQPVAATEPRLRFLPYGLWSEDASLELYAPADASHVSHSIVNLQRTRDSITAECRSIPSLMEELGHGRVDLLKLDVEGAEYAVLESLRQTGVRPGVLCVDFHKVSSIADMVASVERLAELELHPVNVHRTDVTLVHSRHL